MIGIDRRHIVLITVPNVIPNGINLDVFSPGNKTGAGAKPREASDGQQTHTVLGVANRWEERKGLVYFEQLAEALPDNYRIKLVGVDKRQARQLRKKYKGGKITPICRTANVGELAQIYPDAS